MLTMLVLLNIHVFLQFHGTLFVLMIVLSSRDVLDKFNYMETNS